MLGERNEESPSFYRFRVYPLLQEAKEKWSLSSTAHENWQTHRVKCASGRERENVAGNQRERMRKREDGSHCENHF